MITATIVDDEPLCCESLATLLERYCPVVKVLDICYSASAALKSIQEHAPDILFLDIEMPQMNGFELLEQLPEINFELIFTTSYDQYAIKAIRFRAGLFIKAYWPRGIAKSSTKSCTTAGTSAFSAN